jgi:hypothetical protein
MNRKPACCARTKATMKTYKVTLKSKSPYSQGRHYSREDVPMLDKEGNDAYEKRTWRNRIHKNDEGDVFIPPMALKNCLAEAAKFLSVQIPGKGKATYTKHFEAGIMIMDPILIGLKADDVPGESLFVPADGKRGSGKRVTRTFPLITKWEGSTLVHVIDETITEDVLRQHLNEAGNLIGMGRFRPRNNGFYGRFTLVALEATA